MNTREISIIFRKLVDAAGGLQSASEVLLGLGFKTGKSRLSTYGNPDHSLTAPLGITHALESVVGRSMVTSQLANNITNRTPATTIEQLAGKMALETGEATNHSIQAAADGVITQAEADQGCRELDDVIVAARATKTAMQAAASGSIAGHAK